MTRDERTRWLAWMEDPAPLEAQIEVARARGVPSEIAVAKEALRAARQAVRWDVPDITKIMLATGARIGEVLALTWGDIDLGERTVTIAAHLVRVEGEGLHRMPGTKRGEGRTVKVPLWALNMLMDRQVLPTAAWPVFPDALRGWRDPSNVLRVLREARDAAGFEWVTSHVFRKTCATLLDEAGLSAREIADVLEHADPSLTQRVYMGRGLASSAAAAADALEGLL
ncbi:MAG: site-specific integrase [Pseudonocardia sp.]|nr:site-specific integrase [Pseudonocardia sp.]